MQRHRFNDWNCHRIAKLPIGLRIRHRNNEIRLTRPVKPHQSCAFAGCQATRVPPVLPNQNLGPVLEIPRRQGPRHIFWPDQPKAKAVALFLVLLREIFPYLRALAKAPTDFAWLRQQREQADIVQQRVARVTAGMNDRVKALNGSFLLAKSGAIHQVEATTNMARSSMRSPRWWPKVGLSKILPLILV